MRYRHAVTVFVPLVLMVLAFCIVAAAHDYVELGHYWRILAEVTTAVGIPGVLTAAILTPFLASILSRVERRFPSFAFLPAVLVGAGIAFVVSIAYSATVWPSSLSEHFYLAAIGGLGGASFAWLHRKTHHSAA